MNSVDWNPIILALIALVSTIIVTLIPIAVTAFTDAHTARLTQVKMLADNNQDIANGIVAVVQNVYKSLTNSEKLQQAFQKLDARLHLPADQTQQLIEQAISVMTLTWGDEWAKLGGATPAIPVTTVVETVKTGEEPTTTTTTTTTTPLLTGDTVGDMPTQNIPVAPDVQPPMV